MRRRLAGGRVAGLISGRDRARTAFRDSRTALRSRVPLLVAMMLALCPQNEG